tara:strand:+ start:138 stop:452 length:315 start_codon:yes stop_codon:yes gene_type:complete
MLKSINFTLNINRKTIMGQTLIAYLPFVLIFFVMYFFLIRPQNQKQNEHQEMLKSLKKGDKIITRGGIIAKIIEVQGKEDEYLLIDCENNNKLKIMRSFISAKI